MQDIDEIIASAQRPEKTIPLCLRGDLQARWEELERQLNSLDRDASDSDTLGGDPRARDLSAQMAAIEDEMRKHEVVFKFRGLSSKKYSDLLAKHRAEEKKDDNESDGIDWATWPTALIAACAVDPVMTVEQAERLADTITHKQWDDLFATAFAVNRTDISVPFSLSASAVRAATGRNSKPPAPGVSLVAAGSDESLAG
jgi:hypothetical protein